MARKRFFWYRLKIRQKIIGGFLVIILIFNINGVYTIFSLYQSSTTIEQDADVGTPSLEILSDFRLMLTQSKMYITNWVHKPDNEEDKKALQKIHNDYPQFKDELIRVKNRWKNPEQIASIDSVLDKFDGVIKYQKEIMKELVDKEDYENITKKQDQALILEYKILKPSKELITQLEKLYLQKKNETEEGQDNLLRGFNWIINVNILLGTFLIFGGIIFALVISRNITQPIKYINTVFIKLATGELPEQYNRTFDDDEIGQMAESVNSLVNVLRSTSEFAQNIGDGNYDASFKPLSDRDVLGNALVEMRNNLKNVAEKDKRRNWQNEGIAQFGELLRKYNNNLKELSEQVISKLVKYVEANQGGLFILDDSQNEREPFLYLSAAYAWDKLKFLEQRIYRNDGLVGQAWQEQATIELTEIPEDFVQITSGLGKANPSSILIVPLKINEEVFGVVELASFKKFEDFEKEFVEKVAESIASTIASLRINERTQALLAESGVMQQKTTTQTQTNLTLPANPIMENNTKNALNATLKELVESSSLIIETDELFRIIETNRIAQTTLGYTNEDFKGMTLEGIFESYAKLEEMTEAIMQGGKWIGMAYLRDQDNNRIRMHVAAIGIKNIHGKLEKYVLMLQDINFAAVENV